MNRNEITPTVIDPADVVVVVSSDTDEIAGVWTLQPHDFHNHGNAPLEVPDAWVNVSGVLDYVGTTHTLHAYRSTASVVVGVDITHLSPNHPDYIGFWVVSVSDYEQRHYCAYTYATMVTCRGCGVTIPDDSGVAVDGLEFWCDGCYTKRHGGGDGVRCGVCGRDVSDIDDGWCDCLNVATTDDDVYDGEIRIS